VGEANLQGKLVKEKDGAQCDLEEACKERYKDIYYLWVENYFQLLSNDHIPSYEVNAIEGS